MYKCLDCGLVFQEPTTYSEDRTPGGAFEGGSFVEHYDGCPKCSGGFKEVECCELCGQTSIEELKDGLCDNCWEVVNCEEI